MNKVNLSESEWKIMTKLWESGRLTIMQLTAELKAETGWTKNTVITFLKRMEEKGAVAYDQGERAKLYYPLIERGEAETVETKSFLNRVYNGSLGLMMNALIENKALSKEDISELYDILKKAEKEDGGNG